MKQNLSPKTQIFPDSRTRRREYLRAIVYLSTHYGAIMPSSQSSVKRKLEDKIRQRRYRNERKLARVCARCQIKLIHNDGTYVYKHKDTSGLCQPCRDSSIAVSKLMRNRRTENGLCQRCGKMPVLLGYVCCGKCVMRNRILAAKSYLIRTDQ